MFIILRSILRSIGVLAGPIVFFLFVLAVTRLQLKRTFRGLAARSDRNLRHWLREVEVPGSTGWQSKVRHKRSLFTSLGPDIVYYLDEALVRDLYEQIVQVEDVKATSIETVERQKRTRGLQFVVRFVKPEFRKETDQEVRRTYVPAEESTMMMLRAVRDYLIEQERLTFAIESFEYDEGSLGELRTTLANLKENFGVELPPGLEDRVVDDKLQEYAQGCLSRAAEAKGYVAIEGEFELQRDSQGNYVLSLEHEANKIVKGDKTRLRIQLVCNSEALRAWGRSWFEQTKHLRAKVLGSVIGNDRGPEVTVLLVNPIAVY